MKRTLLRLIIPITITWLVASTALACWWLYFGLSQAEKIAELVGSTSSDIHRHQRMLLSEGASLVGLLLVGGSALVWYAITLRNERRRLTHFFSAFSHEIKTPVASAQLRLKLLESLQGLSPEIAKELATVRYDIERIALQLENSLFFAQFPDVELFLEDISLNELCTSLALSWPQVSITVTTPVTVRSDQRALTVIINNIISNAVTHAKATLVRVEVTERAREIELLWTSNGESFKGNRTKLGTPFFRHYPRSGSGIGLYLVSWLTKRLGGLLEYHLRDGQLGIALTFPRGAR